jgi:hypothetical protein
MKQKRRTMAAIAIVWRRVYYLIAIGTMLVSHGET